MLDKIFVSVIIPARNEEKNIRDCLESIKKQTYKKKEIILVDGGSKDKTVEIAKKYKVKILHENPPKGPANARNLGAKNAKGDILFFIDADSVIEKNYLAKAVKILSKEGIDGLTPRGKMYPSKDLIPNLYYTERLSAASDVSPSIIKRHVFLKVMFDPNLGIGEDFDMSKRFSSKGFKYRFEKNILAYHKEPGIERIISESKWWGRTYFSLLSKKHFMNFVSFFWIIFVALLLPFSVVSLFFSYSNISLFCWIFYLVYSLFKILRSLRNGAKIKYAILLPAFKIFRYTFLFGGIIWGIIKRSEFKGE